MKKIITVISATILSCAFAIAIICLSVNEKEQLMKCEIYNCQMDLDSVKTEAWTTTSDYLNVHWKFEHYFDELFLTIVKGTFSDKINLPKWIKRFKPKIKEERKCELFDRINKHRESYLSIQKRMVDIANDHNYMQSDRISLLLYDKNKVSITYLIKPEYIKGDSGDELLAKYK